MKWELFEKDGFLVVVHNGKVCVMLGMLHEKYEENKAKIARDIRLYGGEIVKGAELLR